MSGLRLDVFTPVSWWLVETKRTALFFLGTYETKVNEFLNANNDDPIFRTLFFKNSKGISSLLERIVPMYSNPLFQRWKHNPMLVKKLSAVMHLFELKYFSDNFKTTFWPTEVSFLLFTSDFPKYISTLHK